MCAWFGLGVRESSRVSVRARHRLRGGKDSRLNTFRVILGLHVGSLAFFAAHFGLDVSKWLIVGSLPY